MSDTPTFGRNLLASVGVTLLVLGLAGAAAPSLLGVPALAALGGAGAMGLGAIMVVLAAFYDSSGGQAKLLGWRVHFGTPPLEPLPPDLDPGSGPELLTAQDAAVEPRGGVVVPLGGGRDPSTGASDVEVRRSP